MARYVDGYVLPLPKDKLAAYRKMAAKGGRIWCEHGALQYCEAVGEDLDVPWGLPFPKPMKLKAGETVVFAWIVFKSRAHRDRVNAKVMKDPRMNSPQKEMPFDMKRMMYGGFNLIVDR